MTSTLTPKANPKTNDDPHDFVVVPSDAVRVAPDFSRASAAEEEISDLLRAAARHHPDPQPRTGADSTVAPPVPPVDPASRPAAVSDVLGSGNVRSIGRRAARAIAALLLAACIGGAAIAWQTFGYAGKKLIVKWTPQFVITSLPLEKWGLAAQPASPDVDAAATEPAPPQTAPPVQAAAEAAAPTVTPADPAQSLQSMARDLASVTREVEQLKISIEQLKASQQQMSRDPARADAAKSDIAKSDAAKSSENRAPVPNARPKLSALPPQPPVVRPRKPAPPLPPAQAAAAPPLPQAAAPAAPRQPEPPPPAVTQLPPEPGFPSALRPPMPVQ